MKKILLIAAIVGASALGGAAAVAQSSGDSSTRVSAEASEANAKFSIENMTCATCPISVKKAMERVNGVKSVEIDYPTKVATVTYDPGVTTPADIAAASTNVGYPATKLEA